MNDFQENEGALGVGLWRLCLGSVYAWVVCKVGLCGVGRAHPVTIHALACT